MRPIEPFGATLDKMRDIRAVETFALHDVCLHPDDLFGRAEGIGKPEHLLLPRTLKPRIVDLADAEGTTTARIPVFNVSLPLMQRQGGGKPPFRLFEI